MKDAKKPASSMEKILTGESIIKAIRETEFVMSHLRGCAELTSPEVDGVIAAMLAGHSHTSGVSLDQLVERVRRWAGDMQSRFAEATKIEDALKKERS